MDPQPTLNDALRQVSDLTRECARLEAENARLLESDIPWEGRSGVNRALWPEIPDEPDGLPPARSAQAMVRRARWAMDRIKQLEKLVWELQHSRAETTSPAE